MTTKKRFSNFDIRVGNTLRDLRKSKHFTIEEFAELTNLSPKTISNYENGKNTISIATLIAIHESNEYNNWELTDLFQYLIEDNYLKLNQTKK